MNCSKGTPGCSRQSLVDIARKWDFPSEFVTWMVGECVWQHTLVDRIVTGTPAEHPVLADDPMAIVAEPFAFWALEDQPRSAFQLQHPAITRAKNIEPYFLRKVRILNAAHTALLIKAKPRGFPIVREAVNDPDLGPWLWRLLSEEIVPTLEGRVDQGLRFAEQTVERFKNPFAGPQVLGHRPAPREQNAGPPGADPGRVRGQVRQTAATSQRGDRRRTGPTAGRIMVL